MKFLGFATALALSILALDGLSTPSAAGGPVLDPAEFAVAPPGTVIEGLYRDGKTTKVRVEARGDFSAKVTILSDHDRSDEQRPLCWAGCNPATRPIELDRYKEIWPLEVGKAAQFVRRSSDGSKSWNHELKVTGTEAVETAVGKVDTFVVEENLTWNALHGTATYWYAPSLAWWVKFSWTISNGRKGDWQMTSYTPPG